MRKAVSEERVELDLCVGDQRADYCEKDHSVILSFFLTHDKKSDNLLNAKYWNSNGHTGVSLV